MIINGAQVKRIFRNFSTIRRVFCNGIEVYTPPLVPIARYSAKGRTNQDADRTILKDLEGNGHDIVLRNFGYAGMSGFGGYTENYTRFSNPTDRSNIVKENSRITIRDIKVATFPFLYTTDDAAVSGAPAYTVVVNGLDGRVEIKYTYKKKGIKQELTLVNGENIIPASEAALPSEITYGWNGFYATDTVNGLDITIEQVPVYPDGLVFDGIDDCGICLNLGCGKDYTVILKREFISRESQFHPTAISKRHGGVSDGEFAMDGSNIALGTIATSYSVGTAVTQYNQKSISVQTKNQYWSSVNPIKYNLQVGNANPNDTLVLGAGILQINGQCNYYFKGVIYDLILYNRTLTEEEVLSEIKKFDL